MGYSIGTLLQINNLSGKVIGYIEYINPNDNNKSWTEYRMRSNTGEWWLSIDDCYSEYSISRPANHIRGQIGPEWHKVDEGVQVVRNYGGSVDVDRGERASFVEYEDASEDHTLSVEIWSDGTEYSLGEYVEKSDIMVTGYEKPSTPSISPSSLFTILAIVAIAIGAIATSGGGSGKKISSYLKESYKYSYTTSITGNEKQSADVYTYSYTSTTDEVAKDIIDGIEGYTESVTQKDEITDAEIAIVTKKEYCLVYHPEDDPNSVLVQVSNRKYNYTSDNTPYRSSSRTHNWYRSHYYSSSYSSDSSSFKKSSSAYSMYDGPTVHNIGNGYFDTYSHSVKQSSINSRRSSSGGLSSGK